MNKQLKPRPPLDLENCVLDPKCRPELKEPMREENKCRDCTHCGWNKAEIERRKREAERKRANV
jgi:hypothetical protein